MSEEESEFDFGFDDNCYETSWSLIAMWYLRALKQQKEKEKQKNEQQQISMIKS